MSKLKVAIIGAGNIAGGYDERKLSDDSGVYSHAGAYLADGRFELSLVLDSDLARAQSFCAKWGGRPSDSMNDFLNETFDVVSVCTPDLTHFSLLKQLLLVKRCKTIFVEKPIAENLADIDELISLSEKSGIHLVVNFQRRWEPEHLRLKEKIEKEREKVLSVSATYMKGLRHIGVTLVDTLTFLLGYPTAVQGFNKVINQEVSDYSHEFILFYDECSVVVKTTDSVRYKYNYHLFELDFLLADGRIALVDNSQRIKTTPVTSYVYSGVKVLNEQQATLAATEYNKSMAYGVDYLYKLSTGCTKHFTNTPEMSFNNAVIINKVMESFEQGSVKIILEKSLWKK
jgi:predicted dehydrogenase